MSTTQIIAGDATTGLVQAAGDDGTLVLKTGAAGSKVNALSFAADGTPTFLKSGMVLGTAQTLTSFTNKDFTIPSWVKKFSVVLNAASTNGSDYVQIQLGTSGGFETTGYVSYATFISAANTTAGSGVTIGAHIHLGVASTQRNVIMNFVNVSGNTWIFSHSGGSDVATAVAFTGGGSKTLAGLLTQIRVTTSNGSQTFTSGSVNILYEG